MSEYTCRCDCTNCVCGEHSCCYYSGPNGDPGCGLVEPIAKAIHRCFFHPAEDSPRVEELYEESRRQMIRMARAAILVYENGTKEERRQAMRGR